MINPFYQDNHDTIYCMDFLKNELPDESVQMACTSPPFWGLRKYAGEQDLIWGDNHCEHEWDMVNKELGVLASPKSTLEGYTGETVKLAQKQGTYRQGFCSLCGAWKGAYGLEPNPEMYISHTIEMLREIKRVLRRDGVVFWNIGDSYMGSGQGWQKGGFYVHQDSSSWERPGYDSQEPETRPVTANYKHNILKPKDLCLIPFRVAIAAQEDGWWVRSVIIWSKLNPMPESVTDRPTESHEYLLMLTKSGKSLYWTHRDGGGTRQRPKPDYRWVNQITQEEVSIEPPDWKVKIKCPECNGTGYVDIEALWSISDKCPTCHGKKETQLWKRINLWQGHDYYWDLEAVREPYSPTERWGGDTYKGAVKKGLEGEDAGLDRERSCYPNDGRNLRSVWTFPTQPCPESHFAVFPEKLPELCIKAATPEVGCCSECGAPWERIIDREQLLRKRPNAHVKYIEGQTKQPDQRIAGVQNTTLGWHPTCKCNASRVPSIVLDPFMGRGTTLWVAKKLNRKAIGFDISEEYCNLALNQCRQQVLL